MGLQPPGRPAVKAGRTRRMIIPALLGAVALVLSGCSEESRRLAMPDPVSAQGEYTLDLWQGAWIAALGTGIVVWGLIFYVVVRYRRRSDDEVPVQTRYNLPLEIFYTVAPIIMVIVFFNHTVKTQNLVLEQTDNPDHVVAVVGQKWSWTFNYTDEEAVDGRNVFEAGTGSYVPTLYLPVNETTRFELYSPDVIHNFGVPGFLTKMDVIPGRTNSYDITPTAIGNFRGACYELCGTYHSRMIFRVEVVSAEDYDAYLQDLLETGVNDSDGIVRGGQFADTTEGLETEASVEGDTE